MSKSKSAVSKMMDNVEVMGSGLGFDVVIVATSDQSQEDFWQDRLEDTIGQISSKKTDVIVVHEDWEGGAGNGLGTLYAVVKAAKKADFDLHKRLANGDSVALYHTAGKGTRLAPLPGSESNNKPGVKLPGILKIGNKTQPWTILESVIRQTGPYGKSRGGRLSVFWGDQIFIPSVSMEYKPTHHADILASLDQMPGKKEWSEKGMEKYGLIAVDKHSNATQVEKISYETAKKLFPNDDMVAGGVGVSLGSFSISANLLNAMLDEFGRELKDKEGKMDADPHFWMALTLDESTYIDIMKAKDKDFNAKAHLKRMKRFQREFQDELKKSKMGMFGAVDIGSNAWWWDYGQLKLYLKNNLLVTEDSDEADAMRKFFGIKGKLTLTDAGTTNVSDNSVLLGCNIQGGSVKNSVLVNVTAKDVDIENSVVIQVSSPSIHTKQALVYNVADSSAISEKKGNVRCEVYSPDGKKVTMRSKTDHDGGKKWHDKIEGNSHSFDDIHKLNKEGSVKDAVRRSTIDHAKVMQGGSVGGCCIIS